jgi:hypothetical protein
MLSADRLHILLTALVTLPGRLCLGKDTPIRKSVGDLCNWLCGSKYALPSFADGPESAEKLLANGLPVLMRTGVEACTIK